MFVITNRPNAVKMGRPVYKCASYEVVDNFFIYYRTHQCNCGLYLFATVELWLQRRHILMYLYYRCKPYVPVAYTLWYYNVNLVTFLYLCSYSRCPNAYYNGEPSRKSFSSFLAIAFFIPRMVVVLIPDFRVSINFVLNTMYWPPSL